MLLARYLHKQFLFAVLSVTTVAFVLILSINAMSEMDKLSDHYTFFDVISFILQMMPANISRFYPTILAFSLCVWALRLRDSQELLIIRALGVSSFNLVWSMYPVLLLLISLFVLNSEVIAPIMATNAKQQQVVILSKGQLLSTNNSMWLKTAEGYLHTWQKNRFDMLEDLTHYVFKDGKFIGWLSAKKAYWHDNKWKCDKAYWHYLQGDVQKKVEKKDLVLPFKIKPDMFSQSKLRSTYLNLQQIYQGVSLGKGYGVMDKLTWVNFWLRIFTPVYSLFLFSFILLILQSGLDLRSTLFWKCLVFTVILIVFNFTILEIMDSMPFDIGFMHACIIGFLPLAVILFMIVALSFIKI